jgi:hypothetical protein
VARIDSYRFGEIVVDGRTYRSDIIIFPDRVNSGWWRREGHSLDIEDLREAMEAGPEVLLIGTGCYGRLRVPAGLIDRLEEEGCHVLAFDTKTACDTYDRISTDKKTVGLFHLTC